MRQARHRSCYRRLRGCGCGLLLTINAQELPTKQNLNMRLRLRRSAMTVTTGKQKKKLSSLKFLMTFSLFAQGNESQQRHYVGN